MGATVRTVPAETVRDFRTRHKLGIQANVDKLLGFSSKGRTWRRLESDGAPHYVGLLIAYGNKYGLELMEEMSKQKCEGTFPPTEPQDVIDFCDRHGIRTQSELAKLFGFTSDGRAIRIWESQGAPHYVGFVFRYVDRYGIELMREIAPNLKSAA